MPTFTSPPKVTPPPPPVGSLWKAKPERGYIQGECIIVTKEEFVQAWPTATTYPTSVFLKYTTTNRIYQCSHDFYEYYERVVGVSKQQPSNKKPYVDYTYSKGPEGETGGPSGLKFL